jgi:serine protein kinase
MDHSGFLTTVGRVVADGFASSRHLLSFESYLAQVATAPTRHLRGSAQYLVDAIDSFGFAEVEHPSGVVRRFKVFDTAEESQEGRIAGQEEIQNRIYRLLKNFVRLGHVNKLILLHGPNGSAKSSLLSALKRGLERYSQTEAGAAYTFNWIFPKEKLLKGSIGFGDKIEKAGTLASYAHLDAEEIEVRLSGGLKEHPLLLIPKKERLAFAQNVLHEKGVVDFSLPTFLLEGDLSHKSKKIYDALLAVYAGDWLKVLRHVQVERFYHSRRYQVGAVTIEPQMSVDAGLQQVSADRTQAQLPPSLHNVALFESRGPLIDANRGLLEYSDLLKRPLETFKYLLGFSETQQLLVDGSVVSLDEVLVASSNEKHLAAFKELPDFSSFKGRIELIRVPYLRRWKVEREIYEASVTPSSIGRPIAPHALSVAALWATLTRLKKPSSERYSAQSRSLVERLTPIEKAVLYQDFVAPERLSLSQQKELKKLSLALYEESDSYPHYEGRTGASAREMKTILLNASQNADHDTLHPVAVLKELRDLVQDRSVYEFLQQEVVDGFHDHAEFIVAVENWYAAQVDTEMGESMGLVSDAHYRELFERYVQSVSAWVKGERVSNKVTGQSEKPDEARIIDFEGYIRSKADDPLEFRKSIISSVGAWRIENADAKVDYAVIFPDLFSRLTQHFFEERRKQLRRVIENVLRSFTDERAIMAPKDLQQVGTVLETMQRRFGYSPQAAKDAAVFLMKKRYA